MKRLCLVNFLLCLCVFVYSNRIGHFSKKVSADNVKASEVSNYFDKWFELDENSTFIKFADNTDACGIQHISYQQYQNGIEMEGCLLLVHARNGKVEYLNGVVWEKSYIPQSMNVAINKRKALAHINKETNENTVQYLLTPIYLNDTVFYRPAYKIFSEEDMADIYIDAEADTILKKISKRYYAQSIQGTASTYYSQIQNINCIYDSVYKLIDDERGIVTYLGSNAPTNLINYYPPESYVTLANNYVDTALSVEQKQDSGYVEFLKRNLIMAGYYVPLFNYYLSIPQSSSSTFTGTKISTIKITAINTSSWQGLLETNPDLFVTVEDANGIERFSNKSSRVTKTPTTSSPVTFTINLPMWGDGYKLKIWDYDVVGNDLIATLQIDKDEIGTFNYSGNATTKVTIEGGVPNPIFDAHWGMEKTIDYYKETFGRNSFDDYGSSIYQIVNVPDHVIPDGNNNAFATYVEGQFGYMVYGMGNGTTNLPFVELNIMAHEFAHLVTHRSQNKGLMYENESGALNEGFSDIFGMCVEKYVTGSASWLIGHEMKIGYSNSRSMKNPYNSLDGIAKQPKAYLGTYWEPSTSDPDPDENDNGGVHQNSSVLNYWFYLLSEGNGSITNEFSNTFTIQGIGIEKAQYIAYMLNQYYLTQYATFQDATIGSLIVSELLYGYGSAEYQAVQNAWGIVGIGNGYQGTTYDLEEGTYLVLARRGVDSCYYMMSSDLGSASTKRYQAINTNTSMIGALTLSKQEDKYLWEVEKTNGSYLIKNKGTGTYSTWVSGNSANFNSTGKQLTCTKQNDGSYSLSFINDSETRYLSLNKSATSNFFAYYNGTGQIVNLRFEPYRYQEEDTISKEIEYVIVARRNAKSNWFYMTAEKDGTKDRLKAVDSGIKSNTSITTTGLDDKYYWTIEEAKDGWLLKSKTGEYISWTSGNTALLKTTGLLLNYTESTNIGYNCFSLTDNSSSTSQTRYLSLNSTDGNNYFAFYPSQIKDLLLIEKGGSIPTDLEEQINESIEKNATKIIKDGQLYILRGGKMYNAQGGEVK